MLLQTGSRLAPVLLLALGACHEKAPSPQRPAAEPPPVATPPATRPRSDDPAASSRTFSRLSGSLRPAWFLCDGTNRPRIAVVERDEGGSTATLTWVEKREGTPPTHQTYALGEVSAGAGQRFFPLLQENQEVGALHAINPGMLPEPSRALIPPFVSLVARKVDLNCRWMLGVRVMGFDGRRSVLVTQEANTLTYRSFDFAEAAKAQQLRVEGYGHTTPATQTVQGGTEERTPDGSVFTFRNGAYAYVLRAGGEASLEVLRDGQSVQRTDLLAWTYAPPAP
ncbi:hypothetical protein JQX13_42365 [Archangium violaceum]|uniref:hypothetical protein n=1 Tax=Archangium violaceum TaxID=83451 RepID=UPI00193C5E33|nr:hypothetical protein [Archangium violaceum]QRK06659.1 hypothetical protein JQX13_42365 [Archangium violaceum]